MRWPLQVFVVVITLNQTRAVHLVVAWITTSQGNLENTTPKACRCRTVIMLVLLVVVVILATPFYFIIDNDKLILDTCSKQPDGWPQLAFVHCHVVMDIQLLSFLLPKLCPTLTRSPVGVDFSSTARLRIGAVGKSTIKM
jgi:hypothetical protein